MLETNSGQDRAGTNSMTRQEDLLVCERGPVMLSGMNFSFRVVQDANGAESFRRLAENPSITGRELEQIALVIVSKELSNALNGLISTGLNTDSISAKGQQIFYTEFNGYVRANVANKDFDVLADILKEIIDSRTEVSSLPRKVISGLSRIDGRNLNSPFLSAIASLSRDLEGVVTHLQTRHFQAAFFSALAAGIHPDLMRAIVERTPFMFRGLVRRWLSSGEIPSLALAVLPDSPRREEIPVLPRARS